MPSRKPLGIINNKPSLVGGLDWIGQPRQYHRPGRFYSTDRAGAIGTISLVANQVWYRPFVIEYPALVKSLRLEVTVASGTGLIRMGLLDDNNGLPGQLITGSDPGTLSAASTGVKFLNYSAAPIQLFPARVYWTAVVANAAITVRSIQNSSLDNSILGYGANIGATPMVAALTAPFTFGAFPATPPAPTSTTGNGQPLILYEV